MRAAEPVRAAERMRMRLGTKLVLAVSCLSVAMLALLLLWVGPQTTRGFTARGEALVTQMTALLHGLAAEHTASMHDVLVGVIDHTTEARTRTLADLPLSMFGGDADRICAAIQQQDRERGQRVRSNAQVLAKEANRRADARIAEQVSAVAAEQAEVTAAFAADLRRSYLLMCGAALGGLVLVLGLGMYWQVVRPVALLRAATRRVAAGDLEVGVAARSSDEVGALALDFSSMVGQLRESRAELTRLNLDLEQQVQKKTHELVQAQKMASIGTLAGGVAHEFNNLIGGIRGCVRELAEGELDAEQQETIGVVLRATERAAAIVQQLLRFAKRGPLRTEPIDLGAVLRDALALLAPDARRHGVEIVQSVPQALPLRADADALHQVVVNLLRNAVQAMPSGGTLTVAAEAGSSEVTVRVSDTGVGIAEEDLGRVFEPFFTRRGDEKDPAQRGAGLGLSVSFGIVEAHGGRITVASELGKGTTFTVLLPRDQPQASP